MYVDRRSTLNVCRYPRTDNLGTNYLKDTVREVCIKHVQTTGMRITLKKIQRYLMRDACYRQKHKRAHLDSISLVKSFIKTWP